MTRPEDVRTVHDALPVGDEELRRAEGTTRRFGGYSHFGEPRSAGPTSISGDASVRPEPGIHRSYGLHERWLESAGRACRSARRGS